MATTTVKTTYALDLETVGALDALARRWNVSKSEAMRRAIRASASVHEVDVPPEPMQALDELQKVLALAPAAAARWSSQVRAERRVGFRRREERTR
jgi:Ribbon-helix-helix protein, copG family